MANRHCLTGRRPFNGDTPGAVLLALRTLALPKLTGYVPALPQRVDGWFARACALEPEARFGLAREMGDALLSALGVALEPLTPDVEEAPLPKPAERGNPSSTAGVPTVVLDGPTRSAAFPAEGDSFLLAPMTGRSPRAHPQRPVLPLLLAALAGIALTGAAYVGGKRQSRPPDVASTPAVAQASASRLLRTDAPLPGRQVDSPSPTQLVMETKTANLGPRPPAPSPPQPHAPTLPKLPRGQPSRGGPPAPSAAAPSAGVPAATDSAEEPATKPPALAPSASSDEGASHLQGTHNLGF